MTVSLARPAAAPAPGIPWRVALPLASTALLMFGAGVLGSLLPLRFSAMGMSAGTIGLIATAEAIGFLTAFTTVGPLFGERIGFDQSHIVLLMACVSLGGLFLQWPIGYFSDKVDRLYALIGLGAGIVAVAAVLVTVNQAMPFLLLAALFAVFGGLAESLYAVGVAHANDRAVMPDYVALSSTLLFVWSLGAAIGPTTGTYAIQLISPGAFFVYVIALTLPFTLFSVWRLTRRKADPVVESREDFLTYPQTSPEIYGWLPYHKDAPAKVPPPDTDLP